MIKQVGIIRAHTLRNELEFGYGEMDLSTYEVVEEALGPPVHLSQPKLDRVRKRLREEGLVVYTSIKTD